MKARTLVGRNIRRLRVANGVSQEGLGLSAGCEPSYVGRVERGSENPTVDLLEALAKALKADVADLFVPVPRGSKMPPGLAPGRKKGAAS